MDANEMSDRMEIRELAFRYAQMIDDRDYALADEVFAEDGELIGPGFHLVGGAAIREALPSIEHFRATGLPGRDKPHSRNCSGASGISP